MGNAVETYEFPGYVCAACGSTDTPRGELGGTSCYGVGCCILMWLSGICMWCAFCPLLLWKNCYAICSSCGHKQEAKVFKYEKTGGGSSSKISKGM